MQGQYFFLFKMIHEHLPSSYEYLWVGQTICLITRRAIFFDILASSHCDGLVWNRTKKNNSL